MLSGVLKMFSVGTHTKIRHDNMAQSGVFVSFPQKRNGVVFSSGMNYLHSESNIQSE